MVDADRSGPDDAASLRSPSGGHAVTAPAGRVPVEARVDGAVVFEGVAADMVIKADSVVVDTSGIKDVSVEGAAEAGGFYWLRQFVIGALIACLLVPAGLLLLLLLLLIL